MFETESCPVSAATLVQVYYLLNDHQTGWLIQHQRALQTCLVRTSSDTMSSLIDKHELR